MSDVRLTSRHLLVLLLSYQYPLTDTVSHGTQISWNDYLASETPTLESHFVMWIYPVDNLTLTIIVDHHIDVHSLRQRISLCRHRESRHTLHLMKDYTSPPGESSELTSTDCWRTQSLRLLHPSNSSSDSGSWPWWPTTSYPTCLAKLWRTQVNEGKTTWTVEQSHSVTIECVPHFCSFASSIFSVRSSCLSFSFVKPVRQR